MTIEELYLNDIPKILNEYRKNKQISWYEAEELKQNVVLTLLENKHKISNLRAFANNTIKKSINSTTSKFYYTYRRIKYEEYIENQEWNQGESED